MFKVVRSSPSLSTIWRYSLIAALIFPWERNFSAAFRTLAFSKAIKDIMYHRIWERSQTQDREWHVIRATKSICSNDFFQNGKVKRYANMCKKTLSTLLISRYRS